MTARRPRPVAAATSASPSTVGVRAAQRPARCRRGRPGPRRRHPTLSSTALVATTPIVVFATDARRLGLVDGRGGGRRLGSPPSSDVAVRRSPRRAARHDEVAVARRSPPPSPPGRACSRPRHLPTVRARAGADRAELRPRRRSRRRAGRVALGRARAGRDGVADERGRRAPSATTIGTGPPRRSGSPIPRSSQNRITPSAAAEPERRAPGQHDGVERSPRVRADRAGRTPRRGRAAAHLARRDRALGEQHDRAPGARVRRVQCPTRTPGTSVITRVTRAYRRGYRGYAWLMPHTIS